MFYFQLSNSLLPTLNSQLYNSLLSTLPIAALKSLEHVKAFAHEVAELVGFHACGGPVEDQVLTLAFDADWGLVSRNDSRSAVNSFRTAVSLVPRRMNAFENFGWDWKSISW